MKTDPKILIFYASYGEGHKQVSRALLHYFQEKGFKRAQMVDLFSEAHPILNAFTCYTYLKSTAYSPQLYGWSYYLTQNMQHNQGLTKWMNSLCIHKLKEIITLEKPDAIINTFPMLSMSELRQQTGLCIPTYTVLTDFTLHCRWIHPETDKYFVENDDLKKSMMTKGIRDEQIRVSGIPLRQAFQKTVDIPAILQTYGLVPEKKNVLIMPGTYGVLSTLKKMVRILLTMGDNRILIVCGRNNALKTRMEVCFAHEPQVRIFGFVEQVQELMAVSSCMITKAGGITLAEALALHLPVVVFRPVPGQEKENATYLARKGTVLIAYHVNELKKKVQQLLTTNWQLNRIKETIGSLQKLVAAEVIVSDILDEIKQWSKQRKDGETPTWGPKERQSSL